MKFTLYLCVVLCLSFTACTVDEPIKVISELRPNSVYALLFKKEQLLEIWTKDSLALKKQSVLALEQDIAFPIGHFELKLEKGSLIFSSKNDFYRQNKPIYKDTTNTLLPRINLLELLSPKDTSQLSHLFRQINTVSLLIFPNDARRSKRFDPCINCPRRTPELYSNLELVLRDFESTNKTKNE